jgi:hypothetical protein
MLRRPTLRYDDIQKAMEDVRRDRYDYFLDTLSGEVVSLSLATLKEAVTILYGNPSHDYEKDVEIDSEVNLGADLPENFAETIEQTLAVLLNGKRYIPIPERTSSEAYDVMRNFLKNVSDPELRQRLESVLNGPGSFRRYKKTLQTDKVIRKAWHGYNARRMKEVIDKWLLEEIGETQSREPV